MSEVTRLLEALERGETAAAQELLPLVYAELRRLAACKMAHEPPGQTLQPTALVHEAWLRLAGGGRAPRWHNRAYFFAAAAESMRRILIDNARRKQAQRRGGGQIRVDMETAAIAAPGSDEELIEVHEALERFARVDPAKAELVKLRYFVGLTIPEVAEVLGLSEPSVKRAWAYARAWLLREIRGR